jgi:hypothetical protein
MRPQGLWLFLSLCLSTNLFAGELAAPTVAKIIRVIAAASGSAKVGCADKEIAGELSGLGLATDPEAKVCWAGNEKEVVRLAGLHRLVLCGNQDWLGQGASVALTAEGGRPSIYLQMKNLGGTGITLPDSIVKISKVVK